MALETESPQGVLAPRSGQSGSRSLRLLEPWEPDESAGEGGERIWDEAPAHRTSDRRLALVNAVRVELARPSAMVVMQQLLDAWRAAERQLDATFEGSVERRLIQAQVATLRSLYQGLFALVR
jgi:hypothetical protein